MGPKDQTVAFSRSDATLGYALLEQEAPFPLDALEQHAPLQAKLARALGRGLSVHAGCAYTHLLALSSSRLNAVKMHYSPLLGVFPNLMLILTGASGDGKSVPLWFDTMVVTEMRKQDGSGRALAF